MSGLTISAIVPATDAPPTLGRCLAGLREGSRAPDQLLVITEPPGSGPAAARNAGARHAEGELLVFVDSDVVAHPDALALIEAAFLADRGLVALFGSYDDAPEARGAVSGFRNLLHHHVHQCGAGETATFWAGLGAIRRRAFEAAGGFDAKSYPVPSIEDVELGPRLAAGGARIVLDPRIQGTHLKAWSLARMVQVDFARRGLPWTELLLRSGRVPSLLNLGWRHRLSALASLLGAFALVRRRPLQALAAGAVLVAVNRRLYALIGRRRGWREASLAVGLHAIHHLSAGAASIAAVAKLGRDGAGRPEDRIGAN